jgi:glycosyltransferase involved in cell wall biosynthesis
MRRLADDGIATVVGSPKDIRSPLLNFFKSARKLHGDLTGRTFDILHSQQEFGDVLALILKHQVRAKRLVRTVHNTREWRYRPLRRLLLSDLVLPVAFDLECAINDPIAGILSQRRVARALRRPAAPVLANAIDLHRFAGNKADWAEIRAELRIREDSFVIGAVGRLTEEKGLSDLIEAVCAVSARLPNTRLVMVGEGALKERLQQQAEALGISSLVVFTGARSDVERLLASMDILVSSSLYEAMPTVIIEAMAAGVPVIATETMGARSLIQSGVNGWLVPVQSAGKLSEAIGNAFSAPDERRAISEAARRTAVQFSIDATANQQVALYQRLLGLPDDM